MIETIKNKWDVLSPDGFSISMSDTYENPKEAKKALLKWVKNYETQGYYSSVKHGRIPLDEVPYYCEIIQYKEQT